MNILGISAYYHDSAAVLLRDGDIVAAAQEERFTRKKHDSSFPSNAVRYCMAEGGIAADGLDAAAFYDKPILKFARLMETFMGVAPRGLRTFVNAVPVWARQKLWIPVDIESSLEACGIKMPKELYFPEHHESHAASAFFPSPFSRAAILTVDGVGEWATSTVGVGRDGGLELIREQRFPHSLGLLYTAFTYFAGFKVNSGEYKLMGLAPYGEPKYVDRIYDKLIDLRADGSFRMNMDYFGYLDGATMTNHRFDDLFDGPPRKPESEISRREMDIARSIQAVTEEIILRMARFAREATGEDYLCLAGGVALNCVANGRLLREGPFKDIWIQPAAGDAGGALGAAYVVWHHVKHGERRADGRHDRMKAALLGPRFDDDSVAEFLNSRGYPARRLEGAAWAEEIARLIAEEHVVGLCVGRMEFGPRALGARSIVGDARSARMQYVMNLKIKYRESFRPFAPACMEEFAGEYFELDRPSPYMLLVAPVRKERCAAAEERPALTVRERVNQVRSDIPAVTHLDYTARIQTVSRGTNPEFYDIIRAFKERTGCATIINTSFNVRGEPIVCTPEDAYRCFMRTEMDDLVLGSFLLSKNEQPAWKESADWRKDYVLD